MKQTTTTTATATTAPALDTIRAALAAAGINPAAAAVILADAYGTADTADTTPADGIGTACALHITRHSDGGKLAGLLSIGTPATINPRCQARQKCAAGICAKCYAESLLALRKGLSDGLTENAGILSTHLLTAAETPLFNGPEPIRFESFGDTINATHAANYILIARRNPQARALAVWTKNPDHYRAALEMVGGDWPQNLPLIYSVPVIDCADVDRVAARIKAKYPFVAGVFAVYSTRAAARAAGHPINCAHRGCLSCLRCYTCRATAAAPVIITELLKSRQNAETRAAYAAVRAYLAAAAPYLSEKAADTARRAAVRTAAAQTEARAALAGTDPTTADFTAAALAVIGGQYRTTAADRDALLAAGLTAEQIAAAVTAAA